MKPFIVHLLTLLAICFVLSCCKHEAPTEPAEECQYDSSIEEMKKWYYFKTGTWWVYEEQNTGDLDTVTVFEHEDGVSGGHDFFNYYVHHSYDGFDVNYYFNSSFSIHCLSTEECTCHKVLRSRFEPGNFVGEGWIFLYPLIKENYSYLISSDGNTGGQTTLTQLLDSIVIETNTYYDIGQWDVVPDGSESDQPSTYLIAKNFGIIKKELPQQNQIWMLINSNIIQ